MSQAVIRKAEESAALTRAFFEQHAEAVVQCARALAERFERHGRLWVMGNGGSACDAEHVVVEHTHPIVEKRRALPAHFLGGSAALMSAIGNDTDFSHVFVRQVELLAQPHDALLGISTSGASANVNRALERGRHMGLLTIGFAGRDGGRMADLCDFAFVVPSWSIHRIQEVHTVLLHVLWDQLHLEQGADDVL